MPSYATSGSTKNTKGPSVTRISASKVSSQPPGLVASSTYSPGCSRCSQVAWATWPPGSTSTLVAGSSPRRTRMPGSKCSPVSVSSPPRKQTLRGCTSSMRGGSSWRSRKVAISQLAGAGLVRRIVRSRSRSRAGTCSRMPSQISTPGSTGAQSSISSTGTGTPLSVTVGRRPAAVVKKPVPLSTSAPSNSPRHTGDGTVASISGAPATSSDSALSLVQPSGKGLRTRSA